MLHKLRYALSRNRGYDSTEINKQQLEKMVEQGAILVDVRSPQEFEEDHLEKAISLPEYEIRRKAKQMLPDRSMTIVVYCSTGHRGKKAEKILQNLGYKQVYNLHNGMEE